MSLASMSRDAQAGHWTLGIYTGILAAFPAGSLVGSLASWNQKIELWQDFLLSVGNLVVFYLLWQGDKLFRYLTALCYASKAGTTSYAVGLVVWGTLGATPTDQLSAGWKVLSTAILPVLAPLAVLAVIQLSFAVTLLWSRRVRLFLAYQQTTSGGFFSSIQRWIEFAARKIGRRKELDISELGAPSIRRPQLTADAIFAIDERDLNQAVFDLIGAKQQLHGPEDLDELLASLNPGMQMILATWWLEAEVNNGGFHQFFWNKSVAMAFAAAEGYGLIGAPEYTSLTLRAIEAWMQEEPEQDAYRTTDLALLLESYAAARERSSLAELDAEFYKLPEVEQRRARYIKSHPQEFVANFG